VVRFVDDQQIVRTVIRLSPTQLLETDEVRVDFCGAKCVRPHPRQRSGRDDKPASIAARNRGRDEGLSHSHFVAEQGPAEFLNRAIESRHGRQLVRLERDGPNPRVSRIFTENESRDAGADFFRGC
jgi:hypothetical protein